MEAIVFRKSVLVIAILAISGCATFPERDPALDNARLSLDAAEGNPQVATYAPTELDQAAATLRQADDLAANGGRYSDVHSLALLASQRAAAAQDVARLRSDQAALAAQRTASDARIQADISQRQADAAQVRAAEAQHQADEAQRLAASTPPANYDYRRQQGETLYEAPVISVRAVVGPPQERCWVERRVIDTGTGGINVPGAVVGGVVGGILGHQIGSGRGQDVATGIGAATGAVVGANAGTTAPAYTQDVRRCESIAAAGPLDYWDVTYSFRGYEHHVQTTSPPGRKILVNADGEPRI
ncbi:MAG TPA: DUF4398 domain-containing protein [Casimicrobiaceae bacterium]|nr:DUF4398 domain-containing protein [Casimicrobiaceae bacterium]